MTRSLDKYPSYVFRDPLIYPHYMVRTLRSNEGVSKIIDANVRGDPFLGSYIDALDEEIFAEMPCFSNLNVEVVWESKRYKRLFKKVADETRKHGWCVVQFYEDAGESPVWRVFSPRYFVEWIKETDEDGRFERIGVKMRYYDDLGNNYEEELLFGPENLCFLVKWDETTSPRRFAQPDLSQRIMTLAYNIRQINAQLTYAGVKPSFYHFVYGEGIDQDTATSLKNNMQYVDTTAGIGLREDQLSEIRTISNGDIPDLVQALDKEIKIFAGTTRLPLSFYVGERESGGLSQAGENVDMLKIDRKKKYIFDRLSPYIEDILFYVEGLSTDVKMGYKNEVNLEDVKNGQGSKETDSRSEIK